MKSKCCKAPLHLAAIGGMLIYRIVGKQKRYSSRCSECGRTSFVTRVHP